MSPPSQPYWVPLLGPVIPFLMGFDRYMQKTRDESAHGLLSVGIGGTPHVFIYSPSLTKRLFALRAPVTDDHFIIWPVYKRLLGGDPSLKEKWMARWTLAIDPLIDGLTKEPGLSQITEATVRKIEENIPNMISYTDSPIDQFLWERVSNADLVQTDQGRAMEVDLWPFLRHLSGLTTGPAMTGQAFFDNNQLFMQDMFEFDAGAFWLLLGLPNWFPIPSISKAVRARHRMKLALQALHEALDAAADGKPVPAEWGNLDDVFYTLTQRQKVLRDTFSPEQRAVADISVLWAQHANINNLVFWLVHRIFSIPGTVDRIRKEIEPYCHVVYGESILGRQSAPRIKLDVKGLRNCTLLKSSFYEVMRLHAAPWSIRKITRDIVLTEDAQKSGKGAPGSFKIKAGTLIDVPHNLQHLDPKFFDDPEDFIPDRFVVTDPETGDITVKAGNVKTFGGGSSICKGRFLAEREALGLTAAILSLWDIEPAKGDWKTPGNLWATGILRPSEPCRVRISKRRMAHEDGA
ncbi:MAG: hypothetical protein M1814_002806 [Vezdaea aestivalis]|nr:MAG: hypothetical protein M1814_002806 [Vezdaea aestivalis]